MPSWKPQSWKPQVKLLGFKPGSLEICYVWLDNRLRFATKEEAEANVRSLEARWALVKGTRVLQSRDPVNYRWRFTDCALVGLLDVEATWSGNGQEI